MKISLKEVFGYKIGARDGDLGIVHDAYFNDAEWVIRYLIADTTGYWPGGRKVLLSPSVVAGEPDPGRRRLAVALTKEQVKLSPDIDTDKPVSRQEEEKLAAYYRWPVYWSASPFATWTPATSRSLAAAEAERAAEARSQSVPEPQDGRLRSARVVMSYDIQSREGMRASIDDFLADPADWRISYLAVSTGRALVRTRSLVPREAVTGIRWNRRLVFTTLHSNELEGSPVYDPTLPFTPEREKTYDRYFHKHLL